jgi:PAS domain S-box-containing protein
VLFEETVDGGSNMSDRPADEPSSAPQPSATAIPLPVPEAWLVQLVHQAADAVVIADPDGRIRFWNAAATRVLGWSPEEAVGQSLDIIIPERQRSAHWDGYRRVMASGETRYGDQLLRVPSLHPDGQRRSIAFTVTLLKDADGAVTAIAAIIRDETQRWQEERDLRSRLSELTSASVSASS